MNTMAALREAGHWMIGLTICLVAATVGLHFFTEERIERGFDWWGDGLMKG